MVDLQVHTAWFVLMRWFCLLDTQLDTQLLTETEGELSLCDCSSSVYEIFQARILEWFAIDCIMLMMKTYHGNRGLGLWARWPSVHPPGAGDWVQPRGNDSIAQAYIKKHRCKVENIEICWAPWVGNSLGCWQSVHIPEKQEASHLIYPCPPILLCTSYLGWFSFVSFGYN